MSNAVYATNWHNASELVKNDVRFIIARSQKPARITAGKFSVMSLEHLATVRYDQQLIIHYYISPVIDTL